MNINFNDGKEKIILNDNPNKYILFNANDLGIIDKLQKLKDNIEKRMSEVSNISKDNMTEEEETEAIINMFNSMDKVAREELDKVFGEGTCDMAFGDINLMTLDDEGNFIIANFLNAIVPYITEKIGSTLQKHQSNVSKYVDKYKKKSNE